MKRSSFLALLPALSAAPLMAKNFVKTEGGIFLEDPKPIEVVGASNLPISGAQMYDIRVKLYVEEADGSERQVGTATVREFQMHREMYDITCRDNGGASRYEPGPQQWQMNCDVHFNWLNE